MTNESTGNPDLTRWLREPVAPQEVRVYVEVGKEAELSPEFREALDQAVALATGQAEVTPFLEMNSGCLKNLRPDGKLCQPQTFAPTCLVYATCRIV